MVVFFLSIQEVKVRVKGKGEEEDGKTRKTGKTWEDGKT
jgi:hypothetical protein